MRHHDRFLAIAFAMITTGLAVWLVAPSGLHQICDGRRGA